MKHQRLSSRIDLLERVRPYGDCIELGVQAGHFAAMIDYIVQPRTLYLIDAWKHLDGAYEQDPSNTSDEKHAQLFAYVSERFALRTHVSIIRARTTEAHKLFADSSMDFVYVDACHLYNEVRQDLDDWYPKVRSGGMFAGHDYENVNVPWIQVRKAVDDFCNAHGIDTLSYVTEEHCGSWAIVKP